MLLCLEGPEVDSIEHDRINQTMSHSKYTDRPTPAPLTQPSETTLENFSHSTSQKPVVGSENDVLWYGPTLISLEGREFESAKSPVEISQTSISLVGDLPHSLWDGALQHATPDPTQIDSSSEPLWGESMDTFDGRVAFRRSV